MRLDRHRGFAIPSLTQILIVVGLVAAASATVWGAIAWHAAQHFERGALDERAKWNKKKEEERQAEQARKDRVAAALLLEEQKRQAAELVALEFERQWKEARREANRNRVALASCPVGRAAPAAEPVQPAGQPVVGGLVVPAAPPVAGAAPDDHPALHLHWRFVGLHDLAFTGLDGKPLFGAAAGHALAAERADTASPYTLDDVLDVHGENASAHSDCLRKFDEAMSKIEKAANAWDNKNRRP